MKRLAAYVSGNVQKVGYRGRVIDIAVAAHLKGTIANLKDGRVKIIAEGDDKTLEWFEKAIDMKNALIQVSSIEKEYSLATGEFDDFGKIVSQGETDSRLDMAAVLLKDLIKAVNKMNDNLCGSIREMNENLGARIDNLGIKIDQTSENLGAKIDNLGAKTDQMNEGQSDLLIEVKDINLKLDRVLEEDIIELKADMSEIKAALRAKGII